MRINFWGDFVAPSIEGLKLAGEVAELIHSAALNVINFEAPVITNNSPMLKSGPTLSQDSSGPRWLEQQGFNLISLANNHIMDYGEIGMKNTYSSFSKNAMLFGAGSWEEAYRPCIIEADGKKIAFLGVAHCEFGTLSDRWDKRFNVGIAWINHPDVDKIIIETRRMVDYLVVFAHAGVEYAEQPLPEWRDRYRNFIDLGCDAVIASHPHIAQGWEIYNNKPIVYSLGNFYFPKPVKKPRGWYSSLCASLNMENDEVNIEITPIVFDDERFISLDKSCEISEYLQNVNAILSDDSLYMDYINNLCLKKLNLYDRLFCKSGYINIKHMRQAMKVCLKHFLDKKEKSVHIINNLRCESHRWCISRGVKLRDNFQ